MFTKVDIVSLIIVGIGLISVGKVINRYVSKRKNISENCWLSLMIGIGGSKKKYMILGLSTLSGGKSCWNQ